MSNGVDDKLCCGNGVLRVLFQGTAELLPLLLDTRYFATHVANFLAKLSNQPLLLATKWSFFLSCVAELENMDVSSRRVLQRCTSDRPLLLLTPSSAPKPQCPLLYRHIFPDNRPSPPSPVFPTNPLDPAKIRALRLRTSNFCFLTGTVSFLQLPFCHAHSKSGPPPRNAPAPLQTTNTNFAVVWAASFFFKIAEAPSLVSLQTSSLPA